MLGLMVAPWVLNGIGCLVLQGPWKFHDWTDFEGTRFTLGGMSGRKSRQHSHHYITALRKSQLVVGNPWNQSDLSMLTKNVPRYEKKEDGYLSEYSSP